MPAIEDETRDIATRQGAPVEKAAAILDALPDNPSIRALRREGEDIGNILKPLGLPPVLDFAVQLYPVARDGQLNIRDLQKTGIEELPALVQGLLQLGRFSLPKDWKPGEALATSASQNAARRGLRSATGHRKDWRTGVQAAKGQECHTGTASIDCG